MKELVVKDVAKRPVGNLFTTKDIANAVGLASSSGIHMYLRTIPIAGLYKKGTGKGPASANVWIRKSRPSVPFVAGDEVQYLSSNGDTDVWKTGTVLYQHGKRFVVVNEKTNKRVRVFPKDMRLVNDAEDVTLPPIAKPSDTYTRKTNIANALEYALQDKELFIVSDVQKALQYDETSSFIHATLHAIRNVGQTDEHMTVNGNSPSVVWCKKGWDKQNPEDWETDCMWEPDSESDSYSLPSDSVSDSDDASGQHVPEQCVQDEDSASQAQEAETSGLDASEDEPNPSDIGAYVLERLHAAEDEDSREALEAFIGRCILASFNERIKKKRKRVKHWKKKHDVLIDEFNDNVNDYNDLLALYERLRKETPEQNVVLEQKVETLESRIRVALKQAQVVIEQRNALRDELDAMKQKKQKQSILSKLLS